MKKTHHQQRGDARTKLPERRQIQMQMLSLDQWLDAEHRVRVVWQYVESLDLTELYQAIKARAFNMEFRTGKQGVLTESRLLSDGPPYSLRQGCPHLRLQDKGVDVTGDPQLLHFHVESPAPVGVPKSHAEISSRHNPVPSR